MPVWRHIEPEELMNIKFHVNVPPSERVPIADSVDYFNSLVDAFDKSGAVNYLTQSFVDEKTDREFEITIQKVHGESLAEKLDSLKNENEK